MSNIIIRVAVSGYFDPIHIGHLDYLELAKKLGDKLVVIVNNNHQCKLKKGKPFMDELDRKLDTKFVSHVTHYKSSNILTKQSWDDIPDIIRENLLVKKDFLWPTLKMNSICSVVEIDNELKFINKFNQSQFLTESTHIDMSQTLDD